MDNSIILAFFVTLLAGLSTGIGSCIAFLTKHTNKRFLSISLGFSAGVMIYVSMIEIFVKSKDLLTLQLGQKMGSFITVVSFFGGMLFIALIDKIIPEEENPHEVKSVEDIDKKSKKLMRMGILARLRLEYIIFLKDWRHLYQHCRMPALPYQL